MVVGRVVRKSSAVSVSSLPVLAVRERVAIWPSGLPVVKKNGVPDIWMRASSSSHRADRPRRGRTRFVGCDKERKSENNMLRLLNMNSGARGTPSAHRVKERPVIGPSAIPRKRLEIAVHRNLYL